MLLVRVRGMYHFRKTSVCGADRIVRETGGSGPNEESDLLFHCSKLLSHMTNT